MKSVEKSPDGIEGDEFDRAKFYLKNGDIEHASMYYYGRNKA